MSPAKRRRSPVWRWLLAAALLAAVIVLTGRFVERGGLVGLMKAARPGWMIVAVALQLGTYLAQGQIWRSVTRAAGKRLPIGEAYQLSLAKLFVDQTLPSGGVSGTAFAARALRRQGVPRGARAACVEINLTSYYAAYALALAVGALAIAHRRRARDLAIAAGVFLLVGAAAALLFRRWSARPPEKRSGRLKALWRLAGQLRGADPRLLRSPGLFAGCLLAQAAIIGLDATTLWVLLLSLGRAAPPRDVFASFMLANAARSVTFVPGGLGPFEAGAVLALRKLAKVPVAAALSATLLFRLLSFWLPMIPGFFVSRRRYYGVGTQT